jgi:GNAT superfamily N-acetyltransferase
MTPPPPVRVRAATLADAPLLVDFNMRLAASTEDVQLDRDRLTAGVQNLLADPTRGRYYVAEAQGGAVVGQTMLTFEWSDWRNGWFWWIQSVFVRPDHRGQGVFGALYRHIEAEARAQADPRVAGLRLYVADSNESARAVYLKLGMAASHYRVLEVDFVLGAH